MIKDNEATDEGVSALQRFQDGYTTRDVSRLDEFMALFVPGLEAELIGIGASVRKGSEWFQGLDEIKDIIKSDWQYWGDVRIDVENARITMHGDVAWLSTSGELVQTSHHDEALGFYLKQMKDLLESERLDLDGRLMEAPHFGMRRLRERHLGEGHCWGFVFTAVLVKNENKWQFHTVHWAMPVD